MIVIFTNLFSIMIVIIVFRREVVHRILFRFLRRCTFPRLEYVIDSKDESVFIYPSWPAVEGKGKQAEDSSTFIITVCATTTTATTPPTPTPPASRDWSWCLPLFPLMSCCWLSPGVGSASSGFLWALVSCPFVLSMPLLWWVGGGWRGCRYDDFA